MGKHWLDGRRVEIYINLIKIVDVYTGSTLGAALAARDKGLGRTILFIGDGSL